MSLTSLPTVVRFLLWYIWTEKRDILAVYKQMDKAL